MSGDGEIAVQDLLVEEINELKDKIKSLKQKIKKFDDDPSPKDEFSKLSYLEDKRYLTALNIRLTGLEAEARLPKVNDFIL